jgi:hypothetical protein
METCIVIMSSNGSQAPSVVGPFPNAEVAAAFVDAFLLEYKEAGRVRLGQISTPEKTAKSMNAPVYTAPR